MNCVIKRLTCIQKCVRIKCICANHLDISVLFFKYVVYKRIIFFKAVYLNENKCHFYQFLVSPSVGPLSGSVEILWTLL